MPTCPAGHTSESSDFCDVCGVMISGTASAPPAAGPPDEPPQAPAEAPPQAPAEPCPRCGAARSGRFCESCGFDFDAGVAPEAAVAAPAAWTAVVASDRAYFDEIVAGGGPDAATLEFPGYCPERRFLLAGPEMRIGRRSVSQGLEPEIDLTGPPADPGISRLHAVLIAEQDGSWMVLDPGSENGTIVNGREIATGVRVPLRDGDRLHLGAWTVITIHASEPA